MPQILNDQTYYRTSEACQLAGVSKSTFLRWLKSGVLRDVRQKDRRGWRLFTEDDIKRIRVEASKVQ